MISYLANINLYLIFVFIFFADQAATFLLKKKEEVIKENKEEEKKEQTEEKKKKYQEYLNDSLKKRNIDLRSFYLRIGYFDRYLKKKTIDTGSFYKILQHHSIYPTQRKNFFKRRLQYFTNFTTYYDNYYNLFKLKKINDIKSDIYLIDEIYKKIKQFFLFNKRSVEMNKNYRFIVAKLKKWNDLFLGKDASLGIFYKFIYKYYIFNSRYLAFKKIYQRYNSLSNFKTASRKIIFFLAHDLSRSYRDYTLNFIFGMKSVPRVNKSKIPLHNSYVKKHEINLEHKLIQNTLYLNPVPIYKRLIIKARNFLLPDFSNRNIYFHSIRKYLLNNNQINFGTSIRFLNIYLFLSNYIPKLSNIQTLQKLHSLISYQDYLFGLTITTFPLLDDFKFFSFFEKEKNLNLLNYIPFANSHILKLSNKYNSYSLSESELLKLQLHRNYFFRQLFNSFIFSFRHLEYNKLNKQNYSLKYQKLFDFLYKNVSADSFNINKKKVTGYFPHVLTKSNNNFNFSFNYNYDGFLRKLYRVPTLFTSLINSQIRDKHFRFISKPGLSYSRIFNKLNQSRLKLRHNLISLISEFIKLNYVSKKANYYLIYLLNFNLLNNRSFFYFFYKVNRSPEPLFFHLISNLTFDLFTHLEQQKNLCLQSYQFIMQYLFSTKIGYFIIKNVISSFLNFFYIYTKILFYIFQRLINKVFPFLAPFNLYFKFDFLFTFSYSFIKLLIDISIQPITVSFLQILKKQMNKGLNVIFLIYSWILFLVHMIIKSNYKQWLYNTPIHFVHFLIKCFVAPIAYYTIALFRRAILNLYLYIINFSSWHVWYGLVVNATIHGKISLYLYSQINKAVEALNILYQLPFFRPLFYYFSKIKQFLFYFHNFNKFIIFRLVFYCFFKLIRFFLNIKNKFVFYIQIVILNMLYLYKRLDLKDFVVLYQKIKNIKIIGSIFLYCDFYISLCLLVFSFKISSCYQLILYLSNNLEYNYLIYAIAFIFYSIFDVFYRQIKLFFLFKQKILFKITPKSKYNSRPHNYSIKEMISFFIFSTYALISRIILRRLLRVIYFYKKKGKEQTAGRYFKFYDSDFSKSNYYKKWKKALFYKK